MSPIKTQVAGCDVTLDRTVVEGEPIAVSGRWLTPRARVSLATVQGKRGKWAAWMVRNSPIAVRVEDENGARLIHIRDMTRIIVTAIVLSGLLMSLIVHMMTRGKRGEQAV